METTSVSSLQDTDSAVFERHVEPYRAELRLHCYRLTGSLLDADDLVQEALLRAWRFRESFQGRASLRTWIYRIATNVCLDDLARKPRRRLAEYYGSPDDPEVEAAPPLAEPIWLEPFPDSLLGVADPDARPPDARYSTRESVELAFLAAVQFLSPKQRAVLLLRDVLAFSAAETAEQLDMSAISVNSALRRARARLRIELPAGEESALERASVGTERKLVDRFLQAWGTANIELLASLLREDATLSMPPMPSWYAGRSAVLEFLKRNPFSSEWHGRMKLMPTRANGRPALAIYHLAAGTQEFVPFGIMTIGLQDGAVADITAFLTADLIPRFGLPETL
jgi:RNA polymerase sigma-70 factor, ECF subfamily